MLRVNLLNGDSFYVKEFKADVKERFKVYSAKRRIDDKFRPVTLNNACIVSVEDTKEKDPELEAEKKDEGK